MSANESLFCGSIHDYLMKICHSVTSFQANLLYESDQQKSFATGSISKFVQWVVLTRVDWVLLHVIYLLSCSKTWKFFTHMQSKFCLVLFYIGNTIKQIMG